MFVLPCDTEVVRKPLCPLWISMGERDFYVGPNGWFIIIRITSISPATINAFLSVSWGELHWLLVNWISANYSFPFWASRVKGKWDRSWPVRICCSLQVFLLCCRFRVKWIFCLLFVFVSSSFHQLLPLAHLGKQEHLLSVVMVTWLWPFAPLRIGSKNCKSGASSPFRSRLNVGFPTCPSAIHRAEKCWIAQIYESCCIQTIKPVL